MNRLKCRLSYAHMSLAASLMLLGPATQAAPFAYLSMCADDRVQVVDTASGAAVTDVFVGTGSCPMGVNVSSDGRKVYVANLHADTLSVIDAATNTIDRTINVGRQPMGVATSPSGQFVYVTTYLDSTVTVIDTADADRQTVIPVAVGPYGVAVSPDGSHVYVAEHDQDLVGVIDTKTNTLTNHYQVQHQPTDIAVSPDGRELYVTNAGSGTFTHIGLSSGKSETIAHGGSFTTTNAMAASQPIGIAVAPDSSHVYIVLNDQGSVVEVETQHFTTTATIPNVANAPWGIAITPDGRHLYVGSTVDSSVAIVDTSTHEVAHLDIAAPPRGIGQFIGPTPQRFVQLCTQMIDNGDSVLNGTTFSISGASDGTTTPNNLGAYSLSTYENQTVCAVGVELPTAATEINVAEQLPDGFDYNHGYPRWILRDGSATILFSGDGASTGPIDISKIPAPFYLQLVVQNESRGDRIFADGFDP
jgi:YVTN family beta-propeller protein